MDFKDYVKPFKNTIKIIHTEEIYKAEVSKKFIINKQAKYIYQFLGFNEAEISDNPITNPWDDSTGQTYQYLTATDSKKTSYPEENVLIDIVFVPQGTKVIRSRTVYDVITFISEVSGFADIFFISATFFFNILYTPYLLEAELHRHMGPCVIAKKKRKSSKAATVSNDVANILKDLTDRFSLKLSIWVVIA